MAQSRPRHQEESFIIAGNRSWLHAGIDLVFTLFFWAYSLLVILFIVSATIGFNNQLTRVINASFNTINQDIRNLVLLALIIFAVLYAILYLNRLYNKKRFGGLTRRTYPVPTSNMELESLSLMDLAAIEKLQSEDYAVFETNPLTPLEGKKP